MVIDLIRQFYLWLDFVHGHIARPISHNIITFLAIQSRLASCTCGHVPVVLAIRAYECVDTLLILHFQMSLRKQLAQ